MNTSNQFNPPILFIPKEKECYEKRISVLVSIKIAPKNLSLCSSLSHQFTATGTYSDKSTRDITNLVEWYSSNLSSAIVSNKEETKGLITAINTGEAQIFARLDGIMSSDSCLTVTEPVVQMTNLQGSNNYTLDINRTVSTTETTSMNCPSRTFGFGKEVYCLIMMLLPMILPNNFGHLLNILLCRYLHQLSKVNTLQVNNWQRITGVFGSEFKGILLIWMSWQ